MDSTSIYSNHYTYLITNIETDKKYIGVHSCECDPEDDIGVQYFSSSTDLEFLKEQKDYPERFEYLVIMNLRTREEAEKHEHFLHKAVDAARNPYYYNLCDDPMENFNTVGVAIVKDKDGKIFSVSKNDPRYLSGELTGILKGRVTVRDKDGNTMSVFKTDPRYISGELVSVHKGLVTVKDKDGRCFKVSKTDERYLSGELVSVNKGITRPEELKKRISETKTGVKQTEEQKKKRAEGFAAMSPEAELERRRKISEFNRNKIHKDETKKKMSESHRHKRRISINGIEYSSIQEASEQTGVKHSTLRKRCKSLTTFRDHFYV